GDEVDRARRAVYAQPRGVLVEEQNSRCCRESKPDFQGSALTVRQITGPDTLTATQADAFKNGGSLVLRCRIARTITPDVERALAHGRQRDDEVVQCSIVVEDVDVLKRSGHSQTSDLGSTETIDGATV